MRIYTFLLLTLCFPLMVDAEITVTINYDDY